MTVEMTPQYWQAARAIAQEFATAKRRINFDKSKGDLKANELKKVVAYLCWLRGRQEPITVDRLLKYLVLLAQYGEQHGNNTPEYYQAIEQSCRTHLQPIQADGSALIQILGWAARLHSD